MSEHGGIGGRRSTSVPDAGSPHVDEFGVLRFNGRWLSLTPVEELVVRCMLEHLGGAVSRAHLAACAWPDRNRDHHTINVHIHRIRPRLLAMGLVIHTLRGRGFLLEVLDAST